MPILNDMDLQQVTGRADMFFNADAEMVSSFLKRVNASGAKLRPHPRGKSYDSVHLIGGKYAGSLVRTQDDGM